MPAFPAGANTAVQCHVIANHADFRHRIWHVANQGCAFDRGTDLAVFDQIGLGGSKHEFARSDIHLTATEIDRIDALFHRGDNLVRCVITVFHKGVGHARHRCMFIGLAATIPGWLDTHEAGILPVLHIAAQNTILDQDIAP